MPVTQVLVVTTFYDELSLGLLHAYVSLEVVEFVNAAPITLLSESGADFLVLPQDFLIVVLRLSSFSAVFPLFSIASAMLNG